MKKASVCLLPPQEEGVVRSHPLFQRCRDEALDARHADALVGYSRLLASGSLPAATEARPTSSMPAATGSPRSAPRVPPDWLRVNWRDPVSSSISSSASSISSSSAKTTASNGRRRVCHSCGAAQREKSNGFLAMLGFGKDEEDEKERTAAPSSGGVFSCCCVCGTLQCASCLDSRSICARRSPHTVSGAGGGGGGAGGGTSAMSQSHSGHLSSPSPSSPSQFTPSPTPTGAHRAFIICPTSAAHRNPARSSGATAGGSDSEDSSDEEDEAKSPAPTSASPPATSGRSTVTLHLDDCTAVPCCSRCVNVVLRIHQRNITASIRRSHQEASVSKSLSLSSMSPPSSAVSPSPLSAAASTTPSTPLNPLASTSSASSATSAPPLRFPPFYPSGLRRVVRRLHRIHCSLSQVRQRIAHHLPAYEDCTQALSSAEAKEKDLVQRLSRQEADLDATFTRLAANMQELKQCRAQLAALLPRKRDPAVRDAENEHREDPDEGRRQKDNSEHRGKVRPHSVAAHNKLLEAVVRAHVAFYRDTFWRFRQATRAVSELLPGPVRKAIRHAVDVRGLTGACALMQQLAVESLAFAELGLLDRLSTALDVVEAALKDAVVASGESWQAHAATLTLLVRENGRMYPLITQFAGRRGKRWRQSVCDKCDYVLCIVLRELAARCSQERADKVCACIEDTRAWILQHLGQTLADNRPIENVEGGEWEWIS